MLNGKAARKKWLQNTNRNTPNLRKKSKQNKNQKSTKISSL